MPNALRILLSSALVLATAALCPAADESYPIKLFRPNKVGDQYDTQLSVKGDDSESFTRQGSPPEKTEQSMRGELSGHVEVKQTDKKGETKVAVLTIKRLAGANGAADLKDLVNTGVIVEITRGEKETSFVVRSGEALNTPAKNFLTLMFSPLKDSPITDDDVFGSKTSHKVGDSWPVSADVVAKTFSDEGLVISSKNISGTVTLKAAEKSPAGKPALRIQADMDLKDFKVSRDRPGMTIDSALIHMRYGGLYPTDASAPALESGLVRDSTIRWKSADGILEDKSHLEIHETIAPEK
jgi:hypothetical protein